MQASATQAPGERAEPVTRDATAAPLPPSAEEPGGLLGALRGLTADLSGLLQDRIELLSLELRRFGRTLGLLVALGAVALLLAATAWAATWAALAAVAVALGLSTPLAIALVAVVNVAAALAVALAARRLLPRLGLPATRRHLSLAPDTRPPVQRTAERAAVRAGERGEAQPGFHPAERPVPAAAATGAPHAATH